MFIDFFYGFQPFLRIYSIIPSGKHTKSYWKWPFIVDFPIKNGGSFHSYVNVYQRVTIVSWLYPYLTYPQTSPWCRKHSLNLISASGSASGGFHHKIGIQMTERNKRNESEANKNTYIYIYIIHSPASTTTRRHTQSVSDGHATTLNINHGCHGDRFRVPRSHMLGGKTTQLCRFFMAMCLGEDWWKFQFSSKKKTIRGAPFVIH